MKLFIVIISMLNTLLMFTLSTATPASSVPHHYKLTHYPDTRGLFSNYLVVQANIVTALYGTFSDYNLQTNNLLLVG